MYIVFEGPHGSGKSYQSKRLARYLRKQFPSKKTVWTREPGSTEVAEAIRVLVQGTKFIEKMDPMTDCYLYAAARAQSLSTNVRPTLDKGHIVVSDSSFITSMSIQGEAQGFGIKNVLEVNRKAIEGIEPDVVIYIDIDVQEGINRTSDPDGDKFETMDLHFLKNRAKGYKKSSKLPIFKNKWNNIDGSGTKEEVFDLITSSLGSYLKNIKS